MNDPDGVQSAIERGTGNRARGLDAVPPEIDRAVERSIGPPSGTGLGTRPTDPEIGRVPPNYDRRQRITASFVRRREQALNDMSRVYRRTADVEFNSSRMRVDRAALERHEREFREVMRRTPPGGTSLSANDRRIALTRHNSGYDLARNGWDNRVRGRYWRAFYSSAEGRRFIEQARTHRIAGYPIIRVQDSAIANGGSPQVLDFDNRGRPRYVTIDVDHSVPLDRNPFNGYRARNLALKPQYENRVILNRYAARSVFPMGQRYASEVDDIEEFVQRHQLSRRQRPRHERRRRRRRRAGTAAASVTAGLLFTMLGISRVEALAEAGEQALESLQRQRRREARARPIEALDALNLTEILERTFDRPPLELDIDLANQFRRAVRQWIEREYREGGSEFEIYETHVRQAWEARDLDRLLRMFDDVGHPNMYDLTASRTTSIATLLERAEALVADLLENESEYRERMQASNTIAEHGWEELLQSIAEWEQLASFRHIRNLHNNSRRMANQYRIYINGLREAEVNIREAKRVNRLRFDELSAMIEHISGQQETNETVQRQ